MTTAQVRLKQIIRSGEGLLAVLLLISSSMIRAAEMPDQNVDVMEAPTQVIMPEFSIQSSQAEFTGNPAASMMDWWPEDLVRAPIPSHSPEFSWGLALVGGYFLDLDKANPETPSSSVGAFGWFAKTRAGPEDWAPS